MMERIILFVMEIQSNLQPQGELNTNFMLDLHWNKLEVSQTPLSQQELPMVKK